MDTFQFKSPARAFVQIDTGDGPPESGDIMIETLPLEGIWGTNGTAYDESGPGIVHMPAIGGYARNDEVEVNTFPAFFEDPSFG